MINSGKIKRIIAMLLLTSISLSACGEEVPESIELDVSEESTVQIVSEPAINQEETSDVEEAFESAMQEEEDNLTKALEQSEVNEQLISATLEEQNSLNQMQLNSANMLNYITYVSTEISSSKNSRIFLEETYDALINNTSPNVDEDTQRRLSELLDTLYSFKMSDTQRERTEYLYNQNCAQAIKQAIPNPVGLLSVIDSERLADSIISVAYMAVDSYASYKAYVEKAELEHLKETWALDDAEAEYLHTNRSEAFKYMMKISNEYDLPDNVSLTEKDITTFVDWKNNENSEAQIQFFETTESRNKYQKFGPYWLTLAISYYSHGDYEKCLQAVAEYEKLDCRLFRKDYEYAQTLPFAIAAADHVLFGEEYVDNINHYATEIINNSDQDDWRLRYIVAQTCLSLYVRTNNSDYLKNAYTIVKNNVNNLAYSQQIENEKYLAKPVLETIPDGWNIIKKNEAEKRNEIAEQAIYQLLPPVSQALLVNCQLLFSVSEEIGIDSEEQKSINNILHPNGKRLFYTDEIEKTFVLDETYITDGEDTIEMTESTITLPAKYLSETSTVSVIAYKNENPEEIDGWEISYGTREDLENPDTFMITYASENAESYNYEDVSRVTVTIVPELESSFDEMVFEFSVKAKTGITNAIFKKYLFEREK